MSNNRDDLGRFTSEGQKGNRNAKKDFNKEMASHIAGKELYWAIHQCTKLTYRELKEYVNSLDIENESLFTYTAIKKAVSGDFKALQWLWEMAIGKPKQQLDHMGEMQSINVEFVRVPKQEEIDESSTTQSPS